MTAFAPGTREVVLEGPSAPADVELTLVSRTQLAQKPAPQKPAAQTQQAGQRPAGGRPNRGFPSLSLEGMGGSDSGGDQIVPSGMPVPGVASDAATESVSISGNSSGVGMYGLSTDELDQRMRDQQGAFGQGQGGPRSGWPGRRRSRWWARRRWRRIWRLRRRRWTRRRDDSRRRTWQIRRQPSARFGLLVGGKFRAERRALHAYQQWGG